MAPARKILPQFHFPKQLPDFIPLQSLRGKLLATEFFDRLGGICLQVAVLTEPSEKTSDRDQGPIDRGNGLALLSAQVILEVGHVPDRDPLDGERLPIGMTEPGRELPQVVSDRAAGVGGQVMGGEVGRNQTDSPPARPTDP